MGNCFIFYQYSVKRNALVDFDAASMLIPKYIAKGLATYKDSAIH